MTLFFAFFLIINVMMMVKIIHYTRLIYIIYNFTMLFKINYFIFIFLY
nr:MAG TPA: hypothetical protein [Caudoviricetes sp.]